MIRGKKTILRPILKEDLGYLNKWKNTESIYKYLGGGFMPVSIDQHQRWMDSIIEITNSNKRYIITDKNEQPLGLIGLYSINQIHQTAEIGLFIGESEKRGKGYASDAYRALEEYVIGYLNLRKLKLVVVDANNGAVIFWQKFGFKEVGKYHKERYIDGDFQDVIIMEKFLGEYK